MSNKNGTRKYTNDGETTEDDLMNDEYLNKNKYNRDSDDSSSSSSSSDEEENINKTPKKNIKKNKHRNKDKNKDKNKEKNTNSKKDSNKDNNDSDITKSPRKVRKRRITRLNRRPVKKPRKKKPSRKKRDEQDRDNNRNNKRDNYTDPDEDDPFLNGLFGNMPYIRPVDPNRPPPDDIPRFKLTIKDGKLILKKIGSGDGDGDDDDTDNGDKQKEEKKEKKENPFDREGDFDVIIRREIKGIDDLIELGQLYDPKCNKKYNFDVMRLHSLIEPLTELKKLVGMKKVKQNIVNQIVFYLLKLDKQNHNMMHTVIEGSPGVGKTTLGKILAKIYLKMGVVTRDYFKVVKRSDLIAEYVGQTAPKTQKVIDEAKGGVLFIDEAYSLGNPEKKDIFSKECLDTININLSEMKDNFVMIIAGYKDSLKSSFFAYNDGLMRRFPFRYSIDDYKGDELHQIFLKVVKESEWEVLPKAIPKNFFSDNKHYFRYNGGDIESLFQSCKIAHARRVFCCPINERKKLTETDIKRGFEIFLLNPEVKERKEEKDTLKYMFYT
jgi:hypothetical protein